jgi:uncharacterized protein (DUF983 family)
MSSLLQGKCPRCGQGKVFIHKALSIHFAKMHAACTVCQATFQPEPGFYFGAMFVSYAFTVAIMAVCSLVLWLFFEVRSTGYIITFILTTLVCTPYSYRYSRLLWLYWLGGHKRLSA